MLPAWYCKRCSVLPISALVMLPAGRQALSACGLRRRIGGKAPTHGRYHHGTSASVGKAPWPAQRFISGKEVPERLYQPLRLAAARVLTRAAVRLPVQPHVAGGAVEVRLLPGRTQRRRPLPAEPLSLRWRQMPRAKATIIVGPEAIGTQSTRPDRAAALRATLSLRAVQRSRPSSPHLRQPLRLPQTETLRTTGMR